MILYVFLSILAIIVFFAIRIVTLKVFFHPWKATRFICGFNKISVFAKKYGYFSDHPIVGKVSNKKEDIELTQKLLKFVDIYIKKPKQRIFAAAEVICKVLAYRDLKKGMVFTIPTVNYKKKISKEEYIVDKVFNLWNGMPAFGLVPKNIKKTPILLFRGTDFSIKTKRGRSSLLSDLDIAGPGLHTFLNARSSLRYWLKKNFEKFGKTRVMGFSLGGTLAAYTVLFEYRYVTSNVYEPSIAFNPPGISKKIYKKWQIRKTDKKPLFLVFITKNDFFSKFGNLFGIKYKAVPKRKIAPIYSHVVLLFAEKIVDIFPIP